MGSVIIFSQNIIKVLFLSSWPLLKSLIAVNGKLIDKIALLNNFEYKIEMFQIQIIGHVCYIFSLFPIIPYIVDTEKNCLTEMVLFTKCIFDVNKDNNFR